MEQWVSIIDYARHFQVSDMTIRRRIKTGRLSAVLRDGKYYIPVSELSRAPSRISAPGATTHHQAQSPKHHEELDDEAELPKKRALDRTVDTDYLVKNFLIKLEQSIQELGNYRADLREKLDLKKALYEEQIKSLMTTIDLKDAKIQEYEAKIKDLELLAQILEEKLQTITSSYRRS